MKDQLICGIDIGSSKIATLIDLNQPDSEELKVIGFNSTLSSGVKKGLIVDIDQVAAALEESVEKAERMAGHKINHAFVSVGGPHISSLNSHGIVAISNPNGEIIENDVERVIEAARAISLSSTKEIIEVLPKNYIVDGQEGIKNPIGMTGVRLEVDTHIITASSTNLKNINRVFDDLGIKNDGFIFSGLASSMAVLTPTEKELGVVLVDIGGGKMDICIFTEGSLSYSSSVPVGARHITNDIAVGLRVSLDSAEKVKLYLSQTLKDYEKNKRKINQLSLRDLQLPENITEVSLKTLVDEIIMARLEEIFKLIFEEIEKSGLGNNIPSGIVLTGGGSLTSGMVNVGKKILGLPIRVGYPSGLTGLIDEVIDPSYSTTVGLILYGKKFKMQEGSRLRKFNQIFKDFSLDNTFVKIRDFFKQFIP
ncbi:MAG: cell division protein FtsA [Microgenomates group bacterium]